MNGFEMKLMGRELIPFTEGEGMLQKCIGSFIQTKSLQVSDGGKDYRAYCSRVTSEEERIFNDVLFDLLATSTLVEGKKILIYMKEITDIGIMSKEKVLSVLNGLTMTVVKLKTEKDFSFTITPLFEGCSWEPESQGSREGVVEGGCYILSIHPEFLEACLDVKRD